MEQFLFWTFVTFLSIHLAYYLVVFRKLSFPSQAKNTPKNIGISVLICAKNEAENLKLLLPSIIEQDYANYELVLINDHSSDDTLSVMEHYANNYPKIKVVNVKATEAFLSSKKYALTLGIKASSHDYLLFTDGDCRPSSKNWISEMSSHFTNEKTIVLGYGAYQTKPGFLNKLIRFETVITAMHYLGYALLGKPYMGVGRNLAYRKDEFFKVNGFTRHMNVLSGDDDLFINEVANSSNTSVALSQGSSTISLPPNSFKQWWRQKRRHVTTSSLYKTSDQIKLGLSYLSNFMVWILFILLITFQIKWQITIGLIAAKVLITWLLFFRSCKVLNEKGIGVLYPILEPILLSIQLCIFIANLISKPKHWN
ncbi:MAG: glycosyltransferase [bacterium]